MHIFQPIVCNNFHNLLTGSLLASDTFKNLKIFGANFKKNFFKISKIFSDK